MAVLISQGLRSTQYMHAGLGSDIHLVMSCNVYIIAMCISDSAVFIMALYYIIGATPITCGICNNKL